MLQLTHCKLHSWNQLWKLEKVKKKKNTPKNIITKHLKVSVLHSRQNGWLGSKIVTVDGKVQVQKYWNRAWSLKVDKLHVIL